jgi:GNAT superfamily N-acetyltransferase
VVVAKTMTTRELTRFDSDGIVALYRELGDRSRALRFGAPMPTLTDRTIQELVALDGHTRAALGVFRTGALVAEGRWVRLGEGSTTAEAAFTVSDRHQRRGLGTHLLDAVAEHARGLGIETLVFTVSGENRGMAALLARRGIRLSYRGGSGEASLSLVTAASVGALEPDAWMRSA